MNAIIHLTIKLNVKQDGVIKYMALQNTLKALADPVRRDILNLLKKGSLSAGEITDRFLITGAAISRHLSVLKEADLIRDTRKGKFIFYEINTSVLEETMLWIADLKGDNGND
jgi:DNA-binding transcriptional ArsR family regulator